MLSKLLRKSHKRSSQYRTHVARTNPKTTERPRSNRAVVAIAAVLTASVGTLGLGALAVIESFKTDILIRDFKLPKRIAEQGIRSETAVSTAIASLEHVHTKATQNLKHYSQTKTLSPQRYDVNDAAYCIVPAEGWKHVILGSLINKRMDPIIASEQALPTAPFADNFGLPLQYLTEFFMDVFGKEYMAVNFTFSRNTKGSRLHASVTQYNGGKEDVRHEDFVVASNIQSASDVSSDLTSFLFSLQNPNLSAVQKGIIEKRNLDVERFVGSLANNLNNKIIFDLVRLFRKLSDKTYADRSLDVLQNQQFLTNIFAKFLPSHKYSYKAKVDSSTFARLLFIRIMMQKKVNSDLQRFGFDIADILTEDPFVTWYLDSLKRGRKLVPDKFKRETPPNLSVERFINETKDGAPLNRHLRASARLPSNVLLMKAGISGTPATLARKGIKIPDAKVLKNHIGKIAGDPEKSLAFRHGYLIPLKIAPVRNVHMLEVLERYAETASELARKRKEGATMRGNQQEYGTLATVLAFDVIRYTIETIPLAQQSDKLGDRDSKYLYELARAAAQNFVFRNLQKNKMFMRDMADYVELMLSIGNIYLGNWRNEQARLDRLLKSVKGCEAAELGRQLYAYTQINAGTLGEKKRAFEYASRFLDRATEAGIRNFHILNLKGIVLGHIGQSQEAIATFRQALTFPGDKIWAFNNIGREMLANKKYSKAEYHYHRALDYGTISSVVHGLLYSLIKQDKPQEFIRFFERYRNILNRNMESRTVTLYQRHLKRWFCSGRINVIPEVAERIVNQELDKDRSAICPQ